MSNANGSPERRISRGVVAIYKDYTGRGPTRTVTAITDICCTTILHDALTKAEKRLVECGEAETVHITRRKFQTVMAPEVAALVEEVTGRGCQAMLSDHHPFADIAIETVIFNDETAADDTRDD